MLMLMSAVETGQMSAAETRQMYSIKAGQRPVAIVDICLVSAAAVLSQQQTSASALITQHRHSESTISISWKLRQQPT